MAALDLALYGPAQEVGLVLARFQDGGDLGFRPLGEPPRNFVVIDLGSAHRARFG